MHGRHYIRSQCRFEELAALFSNSKLGTEQRLRGRRTERHDHRWFDDGKFRFEPGPTRGNLECVWFFVYAPFAARLPFEMFDNIGDVSLFAIDAGVLQRLIEQTTGWSDEGFARQIFFVARLFADKQHDRPPSAFAENGLCSAFPKIATFAISRRQAQRRQSYFRRKKVCG